jgi:hypothetical protein
MDLVDRSAIPALHAAARRHRAVYVSCLLARLAAGFGSLFTERPTPRTAPCA